MIDEKLKKILVVVRNDTRNTRMKMNNRKTWKNKVHEMRKLLDRKEEKWKNEREELKRKIKNLEQKVEGKERKNNFLIMRSKYGKRKKLKRGIDEKRFSKKLAE